MRIRRLRWIVVPFVLLVATAVIVHTEQPVGAEDEPSAGSCTAGANSTGQFVNKGSDEEPQKCGLLSYCNEHTACYNQGGEWRSVRERIGVGWCELAVCPYTSRCVECDGFLLCAWGYRYSTQALCEADDPATKLGAWYNHDGECVETAGG